MASPILRAGRLDCVHRDDRNDLGRARETRRNGSLGEDNAAERRKGSRANVRAQYNLASSSSFKRLGILSCSANSPRHIPRSTLEPEAARQGRDSPRGVFARRQMCFLRLSEMFGRARARPHKRSMIQCRTPGPDRPSADKAGGCPSF